MQMQYTKTKHAATVEFKMCGRQTPLQQHGRTILFNIPAAKHDKWSYMIYTRQKAKGNDGIKNALLLLVLYALLVVSCSL
jgi:hypothetical protein